MKRGGWLILMGWMTIGLGASSEAWDFSGHMITGQIAWDRLRPEVRERVGDLVGRIPHQWNDGRPYHLVTAPAWMDDWRSEPGNRWGVFHYVDFPYTPTGTFLQRRSSPNLLSQLELCIEKLRGKLTTDEDRANDLGMLVHLVGDVHQPLHAVDWGGDRGGNLYLLRGLPAGDPRMKILPNLHRFWDEAYRLDYVGGKIIEEWVGVELKERPKVPGEGVIAKRAEGLRGRFSAESLGFELSRKDPWDWARESHRIGCLAGYPERAYPDPNEIVELSGEFVRKAREIAGERLVLAGYRLGDLLNDIFGEEGKR